jgi:dihydropyrimidinase
MSVESSDSDVDHNAHEGLDVPGDIELAMPRGETLVEGGEYHGSKRDGRFLERGGNRSLR